MASNDSVVEIINTIPPETSAAALTWLSGGSSPAEQIPVWAFDDTSAEYIDFLCRLTYQYDSGGLTFTLVTSAAATSNAYVMGAAIRRFADDAEDLDTTHSYAFNDASAITAPSAQNEVSYDDVTFTDGGDMDSLAAGELFVLRIYRNASDGSDNMTGDAYLWHVTGVET